MKGILLVDFAGTLIKASVIEEANMLRSAILQRAEPTCEEHAHPEHLYKENREKIEQLTGITEHMRIAYRQNDTSHKTLCGKEVQNQLATNLFQLGMYMAAHRHKGSIIQEGLEEQLKRAKELGYALAIVSGVRTDIISGMLQLAQLSITFDYILGQPPILGVTNKENTTALQKHGKILYALGDKKSDLEAGRESGAKTIFVTWGHASGGEEKIADYIISSPKELEHILR
ncbi:HAD hydrolase-like protein [Candidatus Woesearchaeota archaeon]|nr:HAD hydrolase-like protein [Candidatus Woesearchaeota archaeon]